MIDPFDPIKQAIDPFSNHPKEHLLKSRIDSYLREQVISVFCNPHGLQLLDTLEDLYLRQPVSPAGCAKGYGFMREGENRIILRLRGIVNNAQKEKP